MKVNGNEKDYIKNATVIDLLNEYNLKKDRVVVEINLEILEEDEYEKYIIREDDVIELISFVGGG